MTELTTREERAQWAAMCEAYAACKADYEAAHKVWAHDQTPRNRAKLNKAAATYDYAAHVVSEIAPRLLAEREALVADREALVGCLAQCREAMRINVVQWSYKDEVVMAAAIDMIDKLIGNVDKTGDCPV
jgi:hypothetical protein